MALQSVADSRSESPTSLGRGLGRRPPLQGFANAAARSRSRSMVSVMTCTASGALRPLQLLATGRQVVEHVLEPQQLVSRWLMCTPPSVISLSRAGNALPLQGACQSETRQGIRCQGLAEKGVRQRRRYGVGREDRKGIANLSLDLTGRVVKTTSRGRRRAAHGASGVSGVASGRLLRSAACAARTARMPLNLAHDRASPAPAARRVVLPVAGPLAVGYPLLGGAQEQPSRHPEENDQAHARRDQEDEREGREGRPRSRWCSCPGTGPPAGAQSR